MDGIKNEKTLLDTAAMYNNSVDILQTIQIKKLYYES